MQTSRHRQASGSWSPLSPAPCVFRATYPASRGERRRGRGQRPAPAECEEPPAGGSQHCGKWSRRWARRGL